MLPDNIDDLFRQQLDGHATPPTPDLWARLQLPAADTDPVDAVFQDGLRSHATPPRRELWERLEDEHLRPQPRRRRVVAWWQLSAAAVLLLMLLAGGGLLWHGNYLSGGNSDVAHLGTGSARTQASQLAAASTEQSVVAQPQLAAQPQDLTAANTPATTAQKKIQEISSPQATASTASTSSTPIATTTRLRRPATAHRASNGHHQSSLSDATAATLARNGGRKTPNGQSTTTSPQVSNSVLTPATHDNVAPALAVATPPTVPAAAPEIIEVEVRRGTTRPAPAPAVVAVADATPAPARRPRLRLGGLLRQADHLVHGEAVRLADATGPAETVTVQARLGGRLISKTIQL